MTPNIVSPAKESFPEQAKDTKKKTSKLPSSESMVAIWLKCPFDFSSQNAKGVPRRGLSFN